jgi:uncharacterized protein
MPGYVPRHLSSRFHEYLGQFPCVLLLGARQVGKSTFLEHELKGWQRVDLERPVDAERVARDVTLFIQDHPERVWFDEAQRVPELLTVLRSAIDRDRRPGRFVLSGSASPSLLRGVSETLAGRMGILELGPLTAAEESETQACAFVRKLFECGVSGETFPRESSAQEDPGLRTVWFRGGYPEPALHLNEQGAWRWFDSYVRTLSERDLAPVSARWTPVALRRLLRMLAARHGQTINVSQLGRDFGVTTRTMNDYLDILEGSFLWGRLPSYRANIGKRLTTAPRGYLADTGLLHHLLDIASLSQLEAHPVLGPSWEGWVIEQLRRQVALMEPPPRLHYWRTQAGAEVDLVLELAGRLIPLEIKHGAEIGAMEIRGLKQFLQDFGARATPGLVIYRGKDFRRIDSNIWLVPAEAACLYEGGSAPFRARREARQSRSQPS